MSLDLATIRRAHAQIGPFLHRTPVLTSSRLSELAGAPVWFKCENFQKTGSFKARGATHAVFTLSTEAAASGVVTHSSGNHGAAVARAARLRNIPAFVVMPENSSKVKIAATEGYGAKITFCAPNGAAREAACHRVMRDTGAALVHPFADEQVIAGQGTAVLELFEDFPAIDTILCPVGGGGLLSGTAIVAKSIRFSIRVLGTEPIGADDAARSLAAGHRVELDHPTTIADGLRATIGEPNFQIIRQHVDGIVTVSEASIVAAMRLIWETLKIVVEPSAAVPFAGLLERKIVLTSSNKVGVILTGGNIDLDALPWTHRDR
ncbi:MAG: pyridoxal-phosphate dependent enzyme [Opitutus sp.]